MLTLEEPTRYHHDMPRRPHNAYREVQPPAPDDTNPDGAAATPRPQGRHIALLIGGIFVFFFGLMIGRMTERAWRLHLNADRYIQTELEILRLDESGGEGRNSHLVRVAATGEELVVHDLDSRIMESRGPGGVIGTLPTAINAKGRRMPAWYHAQAPGGVFSDLRIAYLSEYNPLPGTAHAVKVTLVNSVFLVAGFVMIRTGYRRLKPTDRTSIAKST